jgi:hypothetical protein
VSGETLLWIARAHAIAAWMATAAIAAAAWATVARGPGALAARIGAAAAVLATVAGGLGALLEEPYRARLRQKLFLLSPDLGWLFERKLHLAFAAIVLGWGGLSAIAAARIAARSRGEAPADLGRSAKIAWIAAAALAIAASAISVVVARRARL